MYPIYLTPARAANIDTYIPYVSNTEITMATGHIEIHTDSRPVPVLSSTRRWIATLAASVATTYALDFVATGAGLLVVGSQLLEGIGHVMALLLLVASYLAWGAGLWAILKANWDLIQRTGTSTNLLSKAAHDVAARLTSSVHRRRLATHAGYIATELAKEAPYYLGAAGAALFSDSISATDAIVFLAGANLGAAAYEFALAHGMRFFIRRTSKSACVNTERQPRAVDPATDSRPRAAAMIDRP